MKEELLFNHLLSLDSYYLFYEFAFNSLIPDECTMLIFDEGLNEITQNFESLDSKFEILTITDSNKFTIINKEIAKNTFKNNGKCNLNYGMCLDMDTQTVSYLAKLLSGEKLEKDITLSMENLIDLFRILHCDYSCMPYELENSIKIGKNRLEIFKTLLYFEFYKNNSDTKIEYPITANDIPCEYTQITDESMDICSQMATRAELQFLYNINKTIYCLLLKTVIIEFSSKKSLTYKISDLFSFINNELGVYMEREVAVCYGYLKKVNIIRNCFFKKVQINSNKIISTLRGMAWDLTHIRLIEYLISVDMNMENILCFHYLISFDNGLRKILKYYPINRMIIYKTKSYVTFKYPLYNFIKEIDIKDNWIKYVDLRRLIHSKINLDSMIESLENQLLNLQKEHNNHKI